MQTWSPAHAVPQLPQWVGSFMVSAHALKLPTVHAVSPEAQPLVTRAQAPALQLGETPLQTLVHVPQWLGSLWRSTQVPPHDVRCGPQVATQAPLTHV